MTLLVLLTATFSLVGLCQTNEKVSFYGASYIHFPLQEAKGGTDLSFHFRTQWPDAMLILAAGKTDYCLIKLDAGRLKVHINLGAGESEVASAYGLILNDLRWHEVNLTRRDANVTLRIDVIHTTKYILPGRFFELNIHFGVYIGGQGNFNELFLGHTDNLRGCMAGIVYNGANVIEYAKSRRNKAEAVAVSWGCSREFDATRSTEISFVDVGAFISIVRPVIRFGFRWECELRTAKNSGMLLYNAGHGSNANYLGIEIYESRIHVVMNRGNGPIELVHPAVVDDGEWHNVSVNCNQNTIDIHIDDNQDKRLNLPMSGNRYVDSGQVLYIGGMELNKRARAIGKGLKTGDESFNGCLRSMRLNGKPFGPPDIRVSQGIVVGCVWKYPCLMKKKPCIREATCQQLGVGDFQCLCKQPIGSSCTKFNNDTDKNEMNAKTILPVDLEVVSLSQLEVHEGKFRHVTTENIDMVVDLAKYGITDNGVSFTILSGPKHGALYCETDVPIKKNSSFTLRDVDEKKIRYIHDGSESTEDTVIVELKFKSGMDDKIPRYLQGRLELPLRVNVTPVNDEPVFDVPATKVLRLAQGTKKTLSTQLICTFDADTPSEMLTYSIVGTDKDAGYVEKSDEPGRRVETFTQAELERGTIVYVHRGIAKTEALLGLRVSDGASSSRSKYLKIFTYPLKIKVKRNTGLVVVHGSFAHLRSSNISFITNSDDPGIEIRFDIVKLPKYGVIQMLKDGKTGWETTRRFNTKDVDSERVRYLHTIGNPIEDKFEFRAGVRAVKTEYNFYVRITFIHLELREMKRVPVNFIDSTETFITSGSLNFQTNPIVANPENIRYTIVSMPKYGYAMLERKIMGNGDTFTQQHVDNQTLRYRLFKKSYSAVSDKFAFTVDAPQCQPIASNLSIQYNTGKHEKSSKFIEHVTVVEGSEVPLTIVHTRVKNFGAHRLIYNVTEGPFHGWLTIRHPKDDKKNRVNATYFFTDELVRGDVYYHHDDSETSGDRLIIMGISIDNTDFMYVSEFDIKVVMENDNPPEASINDTLVVVFGGEGPLTDNHLTYNDADIGTRPSDIVYGKTMITNGEIYNVDDKSVVAKIFTQQDINDEKILFRHRGDNLGRFEFTVSDGRWTTKGVLAVRANPPFIRFRVLNKPIVVRFNATVVLGLREIDVETNIRGNNGDGTIVFTVIKQPKYGALTKHSKQTNNFTREDVGRGSVGYKHFGRSLTEDRMEIKVSINETWSNAMGFIVEVYPANYWQQLTVRNNKTIYVEETTSVSINGESLEIIQVDTSSSEIKYYVREWPKNGYIEVQNSGVGGEGSRDDQAYKDDDETTVVVQQFDQTMINEGRVYYVQSVSNQTKDRFVVDATNGVTWSRGLIVDFIIIPDRIYVETVDLNVVEGTTAVLTSSNFRITNCYLADKITNYEIITKPEHGVVVEFTENRRIDDFSQDHLNAEMIVYEHNGDESPRDMMKLIIMAGNKTSQAVVLWINVEPVNDEIPVLVNGSIDNVWQGGSVIITPEKLSSIDNDTNPDELNYHVTNIRNGYLWHVESPHSHIYNFTQAQIDRSNIVFTHTNGSEAEFSFVLFDGVHTTNKYRVPVATLPVYLRIERNNLLGVFPLTKKLISDVKLLTVCSDLSRDVKYVVREPPKLGKIMVENSRGDWRQVEHFTQKDVNDSKIMYEHEKPFMDLSANDSFVFDVEAQFADTISNQVFRIDVSVSSGALNRHVSAKTVHVEEGGSAPVVMNLAGIVKYLRINAGIDRPTVIAKLSKKPNHGRVSLLSNSNVTTFTQSQMEGKKIEYFHDDSDTLEDTIVFSIALFPGHVILCNASVPIVIIPINDEPFRLVTTEPWITVVENQTQTITRQDLLTIDPDTGSDNLVYDLITKPNCGRLFLTRSINPDAVRIHRVDRWTQRDIDENRLIYQHNGTTKNLSFNFRVSDETFKPVYNTLTIRVLPIKLQLSLAKTVSLLQGSKVAHVSDDNVKLDTNARRENVTYEVTRRPVYGKVRVRDVVADTFRHTDLSSKRVTYVQTDMTVSNDSFEISARVGNSKTSNVMIGIKVAPMVMTKPMNVFAGKTNLITRKYMDATMLYEMTHSNPVFRLTRKSKYCKLKRIIRKSGEKKGSREREVSRFTHLEIISRVMFLVCKQLPMTEANGTVDSFEFGVSTPSCQPASGSFELAIKSGTDDGTAGNPIGTTDYQPPSSPPSVNHDDRTIMARHNINNDYILFYGTIPSLIVIAVIFVVTIKCRRDRWKLNEENNKPSEVSSGTMGGIIPLPRPPDHLIPATHVLNNFDPDNSSVMASSTPLPVQPSLTSTLPQCKVIPLSAIDSTTTSEPDNSGKYPSGVVDGEEWNSFDTTGGDASSQTAATERTNPLLQKNQYWV